MGTFIVIIIVLLIVFLIAKQNKPKEYSIARTEQKSDELVSIEDVIAGYEYEANLNAYTSLEALNHHKDRISGIPENRLPQFGYNQGCHGIWIPYLHEDNPDEQLNENELRNLEFLKKFRKTYESDLPIEQKQNIISALFKENNELPQKLYATDWFLWDLLQIPGISKSIGEVLYFEGIKTKQDVKTATDKQLLSIPGIGEGRLRQIRAYFSRDNISILPQTKTNEQTKIKIGCNYEKVLEPIEIKISGAQKVYLPEIKFEPSLEPEDSIKQDWDKYNSIINNAKFLYNTARYQDAKEEFLKIYDWFHHDEMFYSYLLKTYRKLIQIALKEKIYNEALSYLDELFEKCSNYSIADIKNYNHVVTLLNKSGQSAEFPTKELIKKNEHDVTIDSEVIELIQELKKTRGLKTKFIEGTSILNLKSLSNYIPYSLPHIDFNSKIVKYKEWENLVGIPNDTYRFQEASNQNAFLSSSKDLKVHLYNWNFEFLGSFDASSFAESHIYLRSVNLSSDSSCYLFSSADKVYLMDSHLNIKSAWQVPFKDGFEKRKIEGSVNENSHVSEYLNILELNGKPSPEEIKASFRKLVIKWHPDRNPDNPDAEEKTRQLIEAYEFLSGEDAQKAFNGIATTDHYWVDLSTITRYEIEGVPFNLFITIGTGEDWIYGTGISDDGSRIYLGCYSGKTYQINPEGKTEKIYFAPKVTVGEFKFFNPILFVTEYNDRKYILSRNYLYILKKDNVLCSLKNGKGKFKWFKKGVILQDKKQIVLFDRDGERLGKLSFKSPIMQVAYSDNILLVESTTKAFTFRVNI